MLPQGQKEAAATDLWDVKIIKKFPISQNCNELRFLALLFFFFFLNPSAQNLLLLKKKKKKCLPKREDSSGNISSDINRWVSVAVLHPLGKRQPLVRSVLHFGFVFPSCCGLCSWLCRLQTGGPQRDSSLLLLLLLFCGDEIVLLAGSFIFVMEVLIFNYTLKHSGNVMDL